MGNRQLNKAATPDADTAKPVAICADDYGVDAQVDTAIVELARLGRLSATSVLVDAALDDQHICSQVQALAPLSIDVGLHLNLTEVLGDLSPRDVMPLKSLILGAHTRRLSRDWLREAIERQFGRFEARFGRCPDYVDGHLHVHQLPMVREQLMACLSNRALPHGFWVRDTRAGDLSASSLSERLKSWVVGHLGMAALGRQVTDRQLQRNHGFFGVYDFTGAHRPFRQMMRQWLSAAQPGALVMTHPSVGVLDHDPIGDSRVQEYRFMASPEFDALLQDNGVRLARLSQVLSSLP